MPGPRSTHPGCRWVRAALLVALATALAAWPRGPARGSEGQRTPVPKEAIAFDDGDSLTIRWSAQREEGVRILGMDAPEVLHPEHDIPHAQPFGERAAGFLQGCLAVADKVELLRSGEQDHYGRTLAYLYLDGKNYSVLAIRARVAVGPSGRYGDNGLPGPYAACRAAARTAGPVPFEEPHLYRRRMRALSEWLRTQRTQAAEAPR